MNKEYWTKQLGFEPKSEILIKHLENLERDRLRREKYYASMSEEEKLLRRIFGEHIPEK